MRARVIICLTVVAGALAGCESGSADPDAGPAVDLGGDLGALDAGRDAGPPYMIPCRTPNFANAVPEGDPAWRGQCFLVYDTWGLEAQDSWPTTAFMLQLLHDEPAVFGPQFSNFGFVPDPDDDLPVGLKRGTTDPTKVFATCATCHVSRLPDGRTWLGAPNVHLDITRFRVELSHRWEAAGHPPLIPAAGEARALSYGVGRIGAETDTYPQAIPVDFPPKFTLSMRTDFNYAGTGKSLKAEAYLSLFGFGAGYPDAAHAVVPFPADEPLTAMLGALGALQPPVGPPQDAAMVAHGADVFMANGCGSCHHPTNIAADLLVPVDAAGVERVPGSDAAFPRGSIATDTGRFDLLGGDVSMPGDPGFATYITFIIMHGLSVAASDGYRSSDLRGLWATAPYLHNGSVPTLDDLLRPAAMRPATFVRDGFTLDTTVPGNSNRGHEFGTTLSDTDRAALVAYLLSL